MCGVVGLITNNKNGFSNKEVDAFEQLLYMDTLRGWDSTGIMYGDTYHNVQVHKAASPGFAFLGTQEWKTSKQELIRSGKWAFGHNRAATRGTITDENAHPFVVDDNIILMQNGTYKGDHKHLKNTQVDTEACAHVISEASSISEALQKINAAFTFIWYNVKEATLYAIHNKERPLAIGYTKEGTVFLASEKDMISLVGERCGFTFIDPPYDVKEGHLLSFTFQKGDYKVDHKDIEYEYMPYKEPPFRPKEDNIHHISHRTHMRIPMDLVEEIPASYVENYTSKEIDELRLHYNKLAEGELIICGLDYYAVRPADKSNKQWYVVGTLTWAHMKHLSKGDQHEGLLCCWMVDCENEKEIIEYATGFFTAKPDFIACRYLNSLGKYQAMLNVVDVHMIQSAPVALTV